MLKQFLALLIVSNYFSISNGCSCASEDDPQRSLGVFCNSDWVAEVTVTDVNSEGHLHYEYFINYTEVYKMPSKFENNYPTKIYSHQQSSACGMTLLKGHEYFLVGNENGEDGWLGPAGTIGIGSCSYIDAGFEHKIRKNATAIDCTKLKDL